MRPTIERTVIIDGVPSPVRVTAVTEDAALRLVVSLGEVVEVHDDPVPEESGPERVDVKVASWAATPAELRQVADLIWGS